MRRYRNDLATLKADLQRANELLERQELYNQYYSCLSNSSQFLYSNARNGNQERRVFSVQELIDQNTFHGLQEIFLQHLQYVNVSSKQLIEEAGELAALIEEAGGKGAANYQQLIEEAGELAARFDARSARHGFRDQLKHKSNAPKKPEEPVGDAGTYIRTVASCAPPCAPSQHAAI